MSRACECVAARSISSRVRECVTFSVFTLPRIKRNENAHVARQCQHVGARTQSLPHAASRVPPSGARAAGKNGGELAE